MGETRLIILADDLQSDPQLTSILRSHFEVVEVDDATAARHALGDAPDAIVLGRARLLTGNGTDSSSFATRVLQQIGEGVAVVEASGALRWANDRLERMPEDVRARCIQLCRTAIDRLGAAPRRSGAPRPGIRFTWSTDDAEYELAVSPAEGGDGAPVTAVVGVLWDVTETLRLQQKIDAIDAAGADLMRLDSAEMRGLNVVERLALLQERIVENVHELLNFDNFEIRLLDRESNQLELVIAEGLTPLRIGEVIFAEADGNGISGWVAATGRSYICPEVRRDPLYREGLDNAASSLTVPLHLQDRVVGVFNIESNTSDAFDENDRQFAEIFGRYIAMAMNILDLLVVERYTTNEQASQTVLDEISDPLAKIIEQATALRGSDIDDDDMRRRIEQVYDAARLVEARLRACTSGPQTVLAAEHELHRYEPDPALIGRRILVVDNDESIRTTVGEILRQKGCDVVVCERGTDAIEEVRRRGNGPTAFELIISDIKMPDRSGYEVFQTARDVAADKTRTVLITGFGYDPSHSIVRASQEGLSGFLFKPFKAEQLMEVVGKALDIEVAV